jgi:hypothetical protein
MLSPKLSTTSFDVSNSHYGTSLLDFSVFLIFQQFHNPLPERVLEPLIFIMRIAELSYAQWSRSKFSTYDEPGRPILPIKKEVDVFHLSKPSVSGN